MEPKRDFKTILYVLTGTLGSGKSRFCNEVAEKMYPPIYYKTKGRLVGWNNTLYKISNYKRLLWLDETQRITQNSW